MVGTFFSGLSKVAKIIFIAGFVLAILICLVIFSYFRGDGGTNKYDASSVQAQATAQVEIAKAQLDAQQVSQMTDIEKLKVDRQVVDANYIEKLKAERGILDVNKKMELDYQKEIEEKQAEAKAAQARARAAAQKAELEMLKSLGD